MEITLEQIGKIAGVSRSTVSLVINSNPRISEKTRKKVLAICRKYGYEANFFARGLASRKSRVIGLILAHVTEGNHTNLPEMNIPELLAGIDDIITPKGYKLTIQTSSKIFWDEKIYLQSFRQKLVDGYLIWGSFFDDEYLLELQKHKIPFILLNSRIDNFNYVVCDDKEGMLGMVNHLIERGDERIGYISGNPRVSTSFDRIEGYKLALRKHNIGIKKELIKTGNFTEKAGYEKAQELLNMKIRPTAITCVNDETAIGAMKAIKKEGLRIPEDIAVVGADDIKWASYAEPPLTTFSSSLYELSKTASEKLITLIEGKESSVRITLKPKLIFRESSGGGVIK